MYAEFAYELAALAVFLAYPSVAVPPNELLAASKAACANVVPVFAWPYDELAYEPEVTAFWSAVFA